MLRVAYIPIGSYEQHGPHLPPETDYLIAKRLTERISSLFKGTFVEGIKIGISPEHLGFSNTKTITPQKFESEIKRLLNRYSQYEKLILINAHGGNKKQLGIIPDLQRENTLVLNTFSLVKPDLLAIRTSKIGGICHAGEYETSLMLYLHPELVKMDNLTPSDITYTPELDPNYSKKTIKEWKTRDFCKSGILGDPSHASREKGKLWFNRLIKTMSTLINDFLD